LFEQQPAGKPVQQKIPQAVDKENDASSASYYRSKETEKLHGEPCFIRQMEVVEQLQVAGAEQRINVQDEQEMESDGCDGMYLLITRLT